MELTGNNKLPTPCDQALPFRSTINDEQGLVAWLVGQSHKRAPAVTEMLNLPRWMDIHVIKRCFRRHVSVS